jgi:hypothetical protein
MERRGIELDTRFQMLDCFIVDWFFISFTFLRNMFLKRVVDTSRHSANNSSHVSRDVQYNHAEFLTAAFFHAKL